MKVKNEKQSWSTVSPSKVAYHFGTSELSVAATTAVTIPSMFSKLGCKCNLLVRKVLSLEWDGYFSILLKNEGPRFLYLGLTPALTRSILYGGLRLGLYEPSKYTCNWAFGSANLFAKIGSVGFGEAIVTALTNPVEVLKVRLQMNLNLSQMGDLHRIVAEKGVAALWKGVGPAMARAATLTASQLATYDETKRVKF
ncbi:hypothetical protein ACFX14_007316 [Malus domestica]